MPVPVAVLDGVCVLVILDIPDRVLLALGVPVCEGVLVEVPVLVEVGVFVMLEVPV